MVVGDAIELLWRVKRLGRGEQAECRHSEQHGCVGHHAHVYAAMADLFDHVLFTAQLGTHERFDDQLSAGIFDYLVDKFLGDGAPW